MWRAASCFQNNVLTNASKDWARQTPILPGSLAGHQQMREANHVPAFLCLRAKEGEGAREGERGVGGGGGGGGGDDGQLTSLQIGRIWV